MYTVDIQLVATLRSYLMTLFTIGSTIVVISSITPVFTLCLIPILIYYTVQQGENVAMVSGSICVRILPLF